MSVVVSDLGRVPYEAAHEMQRAIVKQLQEGGDSEVLYLLEHPHVITMGRNATAGAVIAGEAILKAQSVALVETDRGGDVTYHGPGQLVGYPILKLEAERRDIRRYVHDVEEVLIRTLAEFKLDAQRDERNRGVWIKGRKIASVGIRISRWVTSHGFALNVQTDLAKFALIHPCGIVGCEMTSIAKELDEPVAMDLVKDRVTRHFAGVFGRDIVRDFSLPDDIASNE